ncbi:MAG TPA: hypothetical protein VHD87_13710 [Acidimicrobiales bacterium]|nr:hypothetical protein [Acidimicrobiales bacterium]
MTTDELLAEVAEVLPGAVLVEDLTNSGRAALARVAIDGETYIAKRHETVERFRNEVEALRTLPQAFRPGLVAVGPRVVVMEDLGPGESLADVLLGDDPARAHGALLLWARTLAAALKPSLSEGARPERLSLAGNVDALLAFAGELGCTGDVDGDIAAIEDALSAHTPWFAFGPSDACPDNNRLLADGTMKLFDFEGAGWRHAASEAAYTRAPFCTCWCVAALPDGTTDAMEDAFMTALDPPEPAAFRIATGAAAVAYVFQMAHVLQWLAETDRPMAPAGVVAPARGRQYVHDRITMLTGYAGPFPAIAELGDAMAAAMRTRWPGCDVLPAYPAFR